MKQSISDQPPLIGGIIATTSPVLSFVAAKSAGEYSSFTANAQISHSPASAPPCALRSAFARSSSVGVVVIKPRPFTSNHSSGMPSTASRALAKYSTRTRARIEDSADAMKCATNSNFQKRRRERERERERVIANPSMLLRLRGKGIGIKRNPRALAPSLGFY